MTADPTAGPDPTNLDRLIALPRAAVLMLWVAAYLRGDIGPDDAAELAHGATGARFADDSDDLFDWATNLRRLPLADARLVLPRPGRLAGLVGPPPAITDAIGAGQAIVVTAAGIADHTLVPLAETVPPDHPADADAEAPTTVVRWRRHAAPIGANVPPPATGSARAELLAALRLAADASIALDLVPDEPVPLTRIPHGWIATGLPRHLDRNQAHLLVLASRTLLLVEDELLDPGGDQRTAADAAARRDLLEQLRDAASAALCESVDLVLRNELQRT